MEIKNKEFVKAVDDAALEIEQKKNPPRYNVEVDINDITLKGKGDDMSEAFAKLAPEWFKTRAFIRVSDGDKKTGYDLMTMYRTRKFFQNEIFRGMMIKLLKEKLELNIC